MAQGAEVDAGVVYVGVGCWWSLHSLHRVVLIMVNRAAPVSILIHIGLIISHFHDRSYYYTEALTTRDKVSSVIQTLLGIVWIVGGFLARLYTRDQYGKGNDLWTWSCDVAWQDALSGTTWGGGVVKFASVCVCIRLAFYSAVSTMNGGWGGGREANLRGA